MKEINELMSKKIKGLRAENNLSLENIAIMLNIHRETFRKYENNPKLMDVGIFIELTKILGINPVIFFEQIYGKSPRNEDEKSNLKEY